MQKRQMKRKKFFQKALAGTMAVAMAFAGGIANVLPAAAAETKAASGYTVTLENAKNGSIEFKGTTAKEKTFQVNEKVDLNLKAEDGYQAESLSILNAEDGKEIIKDESGNDIFSFDMPAANLKISATFKEVPDYEEPDKIEVGKESTLHFDVKGKGSISLTGEGIEESVAGGETKDIKTAYRYLCPDGIRQ